VLRSQHFFFPPPQGHGPLPTITPSPYGGGLLSIIGIHYSGSSTRTAGLKSLCVHIAADDALPVEVPPPSRRKYWTRKGIAEWLADAEGMTDDETHQSDTGE
jgi:hypothetical protein